MNLENKGMNPSTCVRIVRTFRKQMHLSMPSRILIACLACCVPYLVFAQGTISNKIRHSPDTLDNDEKGIVEIYRKVIPTVVTITTLHRVPTDAGFTNNESIGSGALISSQNHILTAAHVVEGADRIFAKTQDGEIRPAELIFSESSADIALIQLMFRQPELPFAKLGNSDSLEVGQFAYAIGSPFGLENSFSAGHISAFREFDRLYDGTILAEFIQTDAAINTGNSGGPVFDSSGRVIGIASRIVTRTGGFQGVGMVVAINTAKQLLALENRNWTGFEGYYMDQDMLRSVLNLDKEGGLLIQRVTKGSPADLAGLQAGTIPANIFGQDILLGGDLILEYGSQRIQGDMDLSKAHEEGTLEDQIPVKYMRHGQVMETEIDVSGTRKSFLQE